MKLFVLLKDSDFQTFLQITNLPNCPETFQKFLKTVGTTQISFHKQNDFFVSVPPGSCVRLRTEEDYEYTVLSCKPREKQDKSRRSSSCSIV